MSMKSCSYNFQDGTLLLHPAEGMNVISSYSERDERGREPKLVASSTFIKSNPFIKVGAS